MDALALRVLSTGRPWRKKRESTSSRPGRKEYARLMKENGGSVFVDLLRKVVKVINGGDHSERERERIWRGRRHHPQ